jgi:hypothetical protein
MREHTGHPKKKQPTHAAQKNSRAEELMDFLEDVALNRKTATDEEVHNAMRELSEYLSRLQGD